MTPLAHQIAEAEREIVMRRRVYPRLIGRGKMTPAESAERIGAMEAIRDTLAALKNQKLPGMP